MWVRDITYLLAPEGPHSAQQVQSPWSPHTCPHPPELSEQEEKLRGTVMRVISGHFHASFTHIFISEQCSQMGFRMKLSQGCTTSSLPPLSPVLSTFYSPSLPHPPLQWQAGHSHTAAAPTPQLRPLTPK